MKRIMLLTIIVSTFSLNANVFAVQETRANLTIQKILPRAKVIPSFPGNQNATRVYIPNGNWGSTDCRGDAVDISGDDDHILSVLLLAVSMNKNIDIQVESSLKPAGDACQVTNISLTL